jgi:hypothetical protein
MYWSKRRADDIHLYSIIRQADNVLKKRAFDREFLLVLRGIVTVEVDC